MLYSLLSYILCAPAFASDDDLISRAPYAAVELISIFDLSATAIFRAPQFFRLLSLIVFLLMEIRFSILLASTIISYFRFQSLLLLVLLFTLCCACS